MSFRVAHTAQAPTGRLRRALAAVLVASLLTAAAIGGASAAHAEEASPAPEATVEATAEAAVDAVTEEPAEAATEPAAEPAPETEETPSGTAGVIESPTAEEPVSTSSSTTATNSAAITAAASAIEHTGTAYTTTDGAVYYVPERVTVGDPIRLSGTGWTNTVGDAGSVIGIKLDEGGVSTTLEVANPVTGVVQGNKTIYGIAQADAAGEWEIELPWPTAENSNATWAAGETHGIRLLSGSLLAGDVMRTAAADLTIVAADAEGSDTVVATDAAGREITYTVPAVVEPGEDVVVSGTNWLVADGSKGSVFSVMIDAGYSGDPNTVYTTRDVVNPVTGAVSTDKRLHAIVEADADGSWTATIPYPTSANARLSDGSWTDWAAGSSHQLRFLSGTLETRTTDVVRSLNATFAVAGESESGPAEPPAWAHETVTYTDTGTGNTATAWVQKDVDAGDDSVIKIKGTGWVDQAGDGASTVAVKLNSGQTTQYTRSGDGIVEHPSASGDDTIWVLLAPSNPENHPNVITIDADGDFDVEIDAPDGLEAGQYLSVLFQSGRFDGADILRTITTGFLTVGGVAYEGGETEEEVTCVPTSATPTVTIENPEVSLGGVLHVTGAGWCHPDEDRGGSSIAFKIDEGAYSHLTADLHQNLTIWAVATANAADGTFDIEIQLPDGTTSGANGSSPALTEGAHTLRLLSGSLKTGDTVRSVESEEFVVGEYRPNGIPDPVEASEGLTDAARGGVTVTQTASRLVVTIPGAAEGDWIYLNVFDGTAPRFPWGATWFQADANGRVVASLGGVTLPAGTNKLSVQGPSGDLIGWATVTGTAVSDDDTPTVAAPADTGSDGTTTTTTTAVRYAAAAQSSQAPADVPAAPVQRASQLTTDTAGGVTGVQDGTVVTVTVPGGQAEQWVYVYVYQGATVTGVGWVQLDGDKTFQVDLAALGDGRFRIAVVDSDGELLGWTAATVGTVTAVDLEEDAEAADEETAELSATADETDGSGGSDGGLDAILFGAGGLVLLGGAVALTVLAIRRKKGANA